MLSWKLEYYPSTIIRARAAKFTIRLTTDTGKRTSLLTYRWPKATIATAFSSQLLCAECMPPHLKSGITAV